jgi:hypothetical protein
MIRRNPQLRPLIEQTLTQLAEDPFHLRNRATTARCIWGNSRTIHQGEKSIAIIHPLLSTGNRAQQETAIWSDYETDIMALHFTGV